MYAEMLERESPTENNRGVVSTYGFNYLRSIPALLKAAVIVLCVTLMVVVSLLEVCEVKFESVLLVTQIISGITAVLTALLFAVYVSVSDGFVQAKGMRLPLQITEIILPAASLIGFVANVSVLFNSECYPGRLEFNVLGSFGVLTILVCIFQVVVAVFELLHYCRQLPN